MSVAHFFYQFQSLQHPRPSFSSRDFSPSFAVSGAFNTRLQCDAQAFGNQFGQRIGVGQREVECARHILDAHLGGHGAIGDDLRHLVFAIFVYHIINYFLPALIIKVRIDIGHRLPVRIEKSFEQQVVFDRIDIGDADAIGHHTSGGRSPAGTYIYAELAARPDKIATIRK